MGDTLVRIPAGIQEVCSISQAARLLGYGASRHKIYRHIFEQRLTPFCVDQKGAFYFSIESVKQLRWEEEQADAKAVV